MTNSKFEILFVVTVADILLWREPTIAATLVIGVSLLWFLMEVVEYNFITLICHASMTSMLLFFIWSTASDFLNWYFILFFISRLDF